MKYPLHTIWTAFLTFKNQLDALKTRKNERVIEYIQNVDFDPKDIHIPDQELISKQTGVPRGKVVEILRILYPKLIEKLLEEECRISKVTQFICIEGRRMEQEKGKRNITTNSGKRFDNSIAFNCNLPVMPRVGDTIHLEFIASNVGPNYGYVYEIVHQISGELQTINIFVRPEKPLATSVRV